MKITNIHNILTIKINILVSSHNTKNMFLLLLCLSFLCCLQHTNAFTRDFGSSDDFCSNGPNSYFCSRDCNHYYYCNGQKKGKLLRCPTGTSCKKLGPHKKYADTDAAGVANMFDTWDVTYACEANPIENTCWSTRAPGLCENAARYVHKQFFALILSKVSNFHVFVFTL